MSASGREQDASATFAKRKTSFFIFLQCPTLPRSLSALCSDFDDWVCRNRLAWVVGIHCFQSYPEVWLDENPLRGRNAWKLNRSLDSWIFFSVNFKFYFSSFKFQRLGSEFFAATRKYSATLGWLSLWFLFHWQCHVADLPPDADAEEPANDARQENADSLSSRHTVGCKEASGEPNAARQNGKHRDDLDYSAEEADNW